MSAQTALVAARAAAEGRMTDTCTITRPGPVPDLQPGSLTRPARPTAELYSGPCELQTPQEDRTVEVADREVVEVAALVKVPVTVSGVLPGDVVTVLSSATETDLPGRVLTVVASERKTHASCRRLSCVETVT